MTAFILLKGKGKAPSYRPARLAAILLAPARAPGSPRAAPSPAKGRLPFRSFGFVRMLPEITRSPLFCAWRITPQKLSTASEWRTPRRFGERCDADTRVRRDQSGVQLG